jgi:propionyl-CoA carboxylase beta chain
VLGADVVFALPDASIGMMSPASAVAFVWNDRVSQETSREALEAEWQEAYASPAEAACRGEVDDVIAPEELRARISAALSMLVSKAAGMPERRHPVMPL